MKFKSRIDKTFIFIFSLLSLLFSILISQNVLMMNFSKTYVIVLVTAVALLWLLVIWIFLDTSYKITDRKVSFRSGPFYGTIPLKQIKKVMVDKTSWDGKKVALAKKGLVLIYNGNKEIYFAPKTNDSFVDYLKKVNPDIEIEKNQFISLK
ncbi:PH domain-containing protein [Psychroflexus sp. YR1-1]|uniref:PH domain-containing protein n=1 Tax=Psychroflexus aurantiacus TaxID=2709310 RepID=A0A6B3R6D4_9FLAO|nr:PH domain-containing protein [Psychroflexus aurantiacus]NEV93371.1 PH domain-containing protein [Psychroflexus aurantiacus]